MVKLGSLFDGSGGFPLAASLCDIEPVWASEVEPYPIAVTQSRFPNMKHLGDVSKINGAEIEPVDVITFGSPCQDLSVAGKRAGLKHETNGDEETTRSGLFMEAVRIIKEMRSATDGIYPRIAVWENVPGAFSSNGGEDFRRVLEELIGIAAPQAEVPAPEKGWPYADIYLGDGWSLAYRTFDAQFWGVPQRRRRIFLVADFGSERAGEILFERKSLRGYFAEGRTPWERTSGDAENGIGAAVGLLDSIGGQSERGWEADVAPTLRRNHYKSPLSACFGISSYDSNAMKSANPYSGIYEAKTSRTLDLNGGNPACNQGGVMVVEPIISAGFKAGQSMAGGIGWQEECAATLSARPSGTEPTVYIKQTVAVENHPADSRVKISTDGKVQALTSRMGTGGGNVPLVCEPIYCIKDNCVGGDGTAEHREKDRREEGSHIPNTIDGTATAYTQDAYDEYKRNEVSASLKALGGNYGGGSESVICDGRNGTKYIVRRLTPTECARLQGFPDDWGHIEPISEMTDEQYIFWQAVRELYAEINGKQKRQYSRENMTRWYNKLHTDSAEYKMWGNGIALPCALYVMQGVQDVFNKF